MFITLSISVLLTFPFGFPFAVFFNTTLKIGTRTDKLQTMQDKVESVELKIDQ